MTWYQNNPFGRQPVHIPCRSRGRTLSMASVHIPPMESFGKKKTNLLAQTSICICYSVAYLTYLKGTHKNSCVQQPQRQATHSQLVVGTMLWGTTGVTRLDKLWNCTKQITSCYLRAPVMLCWKWLQRFWRATRWISNYSIWCAMNKVAQRDCIGSIEKQNPYHLWHTQHQLRAPVLWLEKHSNQKPEGTNT